MAGETNLSVLLASMNPIAVEQDYVFLTLPSATSFAHIEKFNPKVVVIEDEGITLVTPALLANENGYTNEPIYRCITLQIHSSLDAVGLTAAFAQKLKEHGLSANVVAGYYHDHIFVAKDNVKKTLQALNEFSAKRQ